MKQTAVEWLFEQLCSEKLSWNKDSMGNLFIDLRTSNILQQAKEMEINQHNKTWDVAHQAGRFEGKCIAEKDWQTFEGYWEENFKQQEQ